MTKWERILVITGASRVHDDRIQIPQFTFCCVGRKYCIWSVLPSKSILHESWWILNTMAHGSAAVNVKLALTVVSICNLAVSYDIKAPQQEVCVTIPRLQCRDYWSVLVGCVYKKSLLPVFPAQIYCLWQKKLTRKSANYLLSQGLSEFSRLNEFP